MRLLTVLILFFIVSPFAGLHANADEGARDPDKSGLFDNFGVDYYIEGGEIHWWNCDKVQFSANPTIVHGEGDTLKEAEDQAYLALTATLSDRATLKSRVCYDLYADAVSQIIDLYGAERARYRSPFCEPSGIPDLIDEMDEVMFHPVECAQVEHVWRQERVYQYRQRRYRWTRKVRCTVVLPHNFQCRPH